MRMAWPIDAPFYNFNEFSIMVNAAAESGVYALFDANRQVLLVEAGEVQFDLLRLAEAPDPYLETNPVFFSFVLAPCEECEDLKRELLGNTTSTATALTFSAVEVRAADLIQ
jgi:hypothetical protein